MPPKTTQTLYAEKKLKEILEEIYYATTSLTHALIKAHRNGMLGESGEVAFDLIQNTATLARNAYRAAIAQPENKIAARPEVSL